VVSLVSAVTGVVTVLSDAGIDASADPRRVNPPGALVVPDVIAPFTKLCRADQVRLLVILVARDSGDLSAYAAIDVLLASVLASPLAPALSTDVWTFERRVLPDSPAGLPALRLAVTVPLNP
jgi:hypothetical protein